MDWHPFLVGVACLADPLRGGYPLIAACTRQATDTNDLRRIGRCITAGQISGLGVILALLGAGCLLILDHHDIMGCAVCLLPLAVIHGLYHRLLRAQ